MSSPQRHSPLAMDADTFRTLGHALVDQIAGLLASVPGRPVTPDESPSAVRQALDLNGPLPESGSDPATLLAEVAPRLFDHSLFNAHPRFFGYITAPPAPIGILGDFLASALNANVGAWRLSPAATELEIQTVRWVAQLIGYPAECGGLLVSGGNQANIVCLLAARAAGAGWDVRKHGMGGADARSLVAYASAETHTWIQKGADIAGLGTDAIRWIPTDARLQIDLRLLTKAIEQDVAAGRTPFLVVGTGGSVSTGVVDPLPEMAALCRERGIWFHVDGAYGGFAAAVPESPEALRALSLADSVAVDPHKWLYAPLEVGCALVRDPARLRAAFAYHPPYYHFGEHGTNFVDYGPQNSRGFRALKVWLALRQAGASGYRQMISDDIRLSRRMSDAVSASDELELLTQDLSITTFRYVPPGLRARRAEPDVSTYLDGLNAAILDAIQRGGEAFVSNAVIHGHYALRACIVNFHTDAPDVDAVPGIAIALGRRLDGEQRPAALR